MDKKTHVQLNSSVYTDEWPVHVRHFFMKYEVPTQNDFLYINIYELHERVRNNHHKFGIKNLEGCSTMTLNIIENRLKSLGLPPLKRYKSVIRNFNNFGKNKSRGSVLENTPELHDHFELVISRDRERPRGKYPVVELRSALGLLADYDYDEVQFKDIDVDNPRREVLLALIACDREFAGMMSDLFNNAFCAGVDWAYKKKKS